MPRSRAYDRAFRDITGKAFPQVSDRVKIRKKTNPDSFPEMSLKVVILTESFMTR